MRLGWEMSYHPRRILPPGETRKRKERESFYTAAPSAVAKTTTPRPLFRPATAPAQAAGKAKPAGEKSDCRLLAGYMAHEFLTMGTLFGQSLDPARLEAAPASGKPAEPKRAKPEAEPTGEAKEEGHASYADVAGILKSDGAHIPGIVNPTQLARWIHQT
ncbi:uncharacterized protein LOC115743429 [Rhodamnia argentea]|uniref:Uncharacterized protein LOC115743429 n=1 Tax=Rhodamnia argentea TaxID=178133 RepID=A0A8B8PHX7_9MYRT|nr:uncharacterized protein LOC115743429 [Rhodamnia argentea]